MSAGGRRGSVVIVCLVSTAFLRLYLYPYLYLYCILTCTSLHPYPSPLPPQSQSHYQSTPRISQQHCHPPHLHCVVTVLSRQPTIRHQSKAQTGCSAEKHPLMLRKTCNGTDRGNFRTRTQPARQLPLACLIAVPRCFDPCIGDGHVRLNDALALSTTAVSLGSSV
jgi:hypothetical protein